jgi:transposase
MRHLGLDVHQTFCEVAIREDGNTYSAGRVATDRESLELFAGSLDPSDEVAMEVTGPAMEIARILMPHVARVVVANAQDVRAISHARVKSDRFDARTLADLLAAGMLVSVWVPDAKTQALRRRVARRASLVRQRTRAKNEIHATLSRALLGRPPVSDLFGAEGRAWLAEQQLGGEEVETVAGCLRQIEFLDGEIKALDAKLAEWAVDSEEAKRLMTIPGVGAGTAMALMAAIGEISRFPDQRSLVAYLGLDPKVRQSGEEAPRHGRISKRGNAQARTVLVEAGWMALRSPGRCGPSASGSAPAGERRSPRSPSPARSPAWPGSCSARKRTTPSRSLPRCGRSCAASNWLPGRRRFAAATVVLGSRRAAPSGPPTAS